MERKRLDTTTAGKATLYAVGDTASSALSSSNRVSSSAGLLPWPKEARPPSSPNFGSISAVRDWSLSPRLGLSVAPREEPIMTIDAATK